MRTQTEAAEDSLYHVSQLINSLQDMDAPEETIKQAEQLRDAIKEEL